MPVSTLPLLALIYSHRTHSTHFWRNPYSSFLNEGFTLKLHHVGLKVDDWQEVERDIKSVNREFAYSERLGEAFIFGYLDMMEELGHLIEFIWAGLEGQKVLD